MNRKQERELALSLNFSQPLLQWLKTGLCFPALARRVTGEDVEVLIGALPSLPLGVAAKWSYIVLHFVADPKERLGSRWTAHKLVAGSQSGPIF